MKILMFIILLLLGGCVTALTKPEVRQADMLHTTVKILLGEDGKGGLGSGVIVNSTKNFTAILTANHVTTLNEDHVYVFFEGEDNPFKAKVLRADADIDIALIVVETGNRPVAKLLEGKKVQRMQRCFIAGHPSGLPTVLTQGFIAAKSDTNFITSAQAAPGNSGGGLFVEVKGHYYLAGIVTATGGNTIAVVDEDGKMIGTGTSPIYHLTIAVNLETIKAFLE